MMVGLLRGASKLYAEIVRLYSIRQTSLTRLEVRAATGMTSRELDKVLRPLVHRKFVGVNEDGRIVPWAPPHDRVCDAVCAELSVTMDEVRSRSQDYKHLRARRLIAKRLRFEFHYPVSAVAEVLNRHLNTVDEYFHRERAAQRSKQRVKRHRAQQNREIRIAA